MWVSHWIDLLGRNDMKQRTPEVFFFYTQHMKDHNLGRIRPNRLQNSIPLTLPNSNWVCFNRHIRKGFSLMLKELISKKYDIYKKFTKRRKTIKELGEKLTSDKNRR